MPPSARGAQTAQVTDEQALAAVRAVRPRMEDSGRGGTQMRTRHIYKLPRCTRCGGPVSSRGMGDDNRTAYWCPRCQH